MFASTLRWRMTTPFGSAVAPDVKMICVMSSRETATAGIGPSARQSSSANRHAVEAGLSRPRRSCAYDIVADEHHARLDETAHLRDEIG